MEATEKVYSITKEHCQSMIDKNGGVCNSCGGQLMPIETVDNARQPTFWAGCEPCGKYHWGTPLIVYEIAKDLVLNHNHVAYSHSGGKWDLKDEELDYWNKEQIAGTTSLVARVLLIHKSLLNKEPDVQVSDTTKAE